MKPIMIVCPRCQGFKGIYGKNALGAPATLPCSRCPNSSGEVLLESLTKEEKNPPKPVRYERDDL